MANGIKSLLTNIQDISTIPTNLIGGMFGNPFNPTQPIQAVLTQNQRDYLTQKALEKGGESGLLSYDDYGTDLKLSDIVTQPFTNPTGFSTALTAGSVSYKKNPVTGEIELNPASLTYDFGGGSKGLEFIDQGGLMGKAYGLGKKAADLVSGIRNTNIGDFFFAPAGAADFRDGEMLQAPTISIRGDYTRAPNTAFADLLSKEGIDDDEFEEMLAEATRKGERQSFLSQMAEFLPGGPRSLSGGITRGIGSLIRNIAPASYGTSGRFYNSLTPQGKAAVNQIYGPGGIMQDYNPISAFGRGAVGAIDNRLNRLATRRAAQTDLSRQRAKDLFAAREKIMQTVLDEDNRYTGPKSSPRGQKKGVMDDDPFGGTSGTTGGGSKIVCTMMNESYGFGNFRNKIWLKHSKDLPKEYEIGYHTIFLPLVKFAKGKGKLNKVVKKTLEHVARHRTLDLKQEMKGKTHTLGRVYRKILEPICLIVGKIKKWQR